MDPDLADAITRELRGFVASARTRRALPATCHVGHPAGEQVRLPLTDDRGLRTDLVVRAVESLLTTEDACGWLTRHGDLATTDADAAWFAATRAGFAHHGLEPTAFVVVTRTAWLDLVTGEQRVWRRIRVRRSD